MGRIFRRSIFINVTFNVIWAMAVSAILIDTQAGRIVRS
jgi:hypothetical protein